jgi:hypothetical protein
MRLAAQLLWQEQLHLGQGKPSTVTPCPYQAAHGVKPAEELTAKSEAMRHVAVSGVNSDGAVQSRGAKENEEPLWKQREREHGGDRERASNARQACTLTGKLLCE